MECCNSGEITLPKSPVRPGHGGESWVWALSILLFARLANRLFLEHLQLFPSAVRGEGSRMVQVMVSLHCRVLHLGACAVAGRWVMARRLSWCHS